MDSERMVISMLSLSAQERELLWETYLLTTAVGKENYGKEGMQEIKIFQLLLFVPGYEIFSSLRLSGNWQ